MMLPVLRHLLVAAALLALGSNCLAAKMAWPTVSLPEGANAFDIGEQVTVNGLPMRMQGFLSDASREHVAAWFRRSLGQPLVENTLADKLILGRAQGEHYLTVQLERAGTGTRGLIAVTQLQAAYDNRFDTQRANERWLARLPSGSRLIRQMSSNDAGKVSRHLVFVNGYSPELNRDRLQNLLHEDGLEMEREASGAANRPGLPATESKTLFFKGRGKEAIAVIFRNGDGKTAVVLNTVTQMEQLK